jgi:hypothetical protein
VAAASHFVRNNQEWALDIAHMRDNLQITMNATCAPQSTKKTIGVDLGVRWNRHSVLDRDGAIIEENRV